MLTIISKTTSIKSLLFNKGLFIVTFLILAYSCGKSETSNPPIEVEVEQKEEENDFGDLPVKTVNYEIGLPSNSSIDINNLTVKSIVDESKVSSGNDLKIIESDGYELMFVEDANGKVLLYGQINSSVNSSLAINSESTAMTMLMLHPWTMNLTTQSKREAMDYIRTLDVYAGYLKEVESRIEARTVNDMNVDSIVESIIDHLLATNKQSIEFEGSALLVNISGDNIVLSSRGTVLGHGVRLYDGEGNELEEVHYLQGKGGFASLGRLVDLFTDRSKSLVSEELVIPAPTEGQWSIKIKNGFPISDTSKENKLAMIDNLGRFILNIIGVVSPGLKKAVGGCTTELATLMLDKSPELFNDFYLNKDDKALFKGLIKLFGSFVQDFFDVVTACSKKIPTNSTFFGKLKIAFKKVAQIDKLENAVEAGAFITDWAIYENNQEFCFVKSDSEVFYCEGLEVSGDLDFGEVTVGLKPQRTLTLTNTLDVGIEITDIKLPNGYSINWSVGNIPAMQTQEIAVIFSPTEEVEYSGVIEISSDILSEKTVSEVSGIGAEKSNKEQENLDTMEQYRWDFEYSENCTFSHTSSSFDGVKTSPTSCPSLNKGYFSGSTFNNTTQPKDGESNDLQFAGNSVNFSYVRIEKTNTQETNTTWNYSLQYDKNTNSFTGTYSQTYYSTHPISGSWLRYVWSGTSSLRSSPKN